MAIARQTDLTKIDPLRGAITRRYTAGATIAAGELVQMQSDGYVDPTNTTSAAAKVAGVALQSVTAAQPLDVVVFGPVSCVTGGTAGATLHASDTAGEPAESAGSNAGIAGWVESATVVFINPVIN